jgi:hypothetical protein
MDMTRLLKDRLKVRPEGDGVIREVVNRSATPSQSDGAASSGQASSCFLALAETGAQKHATGEVVGASVRALRVSIEG